MLAPAFSIAPVFLLTLVGWICGRRNLFTPEQLRGFAGFVLNLALPALVFGALAGQPADAILHPRYLIIYGLASLAMLGLGFVWFRARRGLPRPASMVRALGMAGSNSGLVGIPVLTTFFGLTASVPIALTMIVENVLVIPLVLMVCGMGAHGAGLRAAVGTALRTIVSAPLCQAIAAGLLASLLDLDIPAPLLKALAMLGQASAPVALVFIGATIAHSRPTADRGALSLLVIGKLVLHPTLVLGLAMLLPLEDPDLRAVAIALGAMPMMSVVPILAQRHDEDSGFLATALVWQTVLAGFSIPLWLWIVG